MLFAVPSTDIEPPSMTVAMFIVAPPAMVRRPYSTVALFIVAPAAVTNLLVGDRRIHQATRNHRKISGLIYFVSDRAED